MAGFYLAGDSRRQNFWRPAARGSGKNGASHAAHPGVTGIFSDAASRGAKLPDGGWPSQDQVYGDGVACFTTAATIASVPDPRGVGPAIATKLPAVLRSLAPSGMPTAPDSGQAAQSSGTPADRNYAHCQRAVVLFSFHAGNRHLSLNGTERSPIFRIPNSNTGCQKVAANCTFGFTSSDFFASIYPF